MKKTIIRTLSISALSIIGQSAFAVTDEVESDKAEFTENTEEGIKVADATGTSGSTLFTQEQIDALKAEVLKKDPTETVVKAAGQIQFNTNVFDSTRSNIPDFNASNARFGLQAASGIVSGQIEVEFNGNRIKEEKHNKLTIRRAQLDLDVLNFKKGTNNFKTTLSFGGIRVGNADGTGPDIQSTVTGYGRQDGLFIKETMVLAKDTTIELGTGAFNNIVASAYGAVNDPSKTAPDNRKDFSDDDGLGTIQSDWSSSSLNMSPGYFAHTKVIHNFNEKQTVTLTGMFGQQDKAPTNKPSVAQTFDEVRSIKHVEASLMYNHKGIFGSNAVLSGNGISIFYEGEDFGRSKKATKNATGGYGYSDAKGYNDSQTHTLLGVSLGGDTADYLTNFMQKGDRLTYAAGFSTAEEIFGNQNASRNYKYYQYSGSVGYAVSSFEVAANVAYYNSDKKIFSSSTDPKVNENSKAKAYLSAYYKF